MGFLGFSPRVMGAHGPGVFAAMPATWVALFLCVITSVCAVEGRWAAGGHAAQLVQGKGVNE